MEFCPECGSIMVPDDDIFRCNSCEVVMDIQEDYKSKEDSQGSEIPVIEGNNENTLPTTDETCPECGHRKAAWWMRQLRSADESETRFFRCLECDHTWREYD